MGEFGGCLIEAETLRSVLQREDKVNGTAIGVEVFNDASGTVFSLTGGAEIATISSALFALRRVLDEDNPVSIADCLGVVEQDNYRLVTEQLIDGAKTVDLRVSNNVSWVLGEQRVIKNIFASQRALL
jgi:hypothetical protein